MAEINLTLDDLLVPDIPEYTPPVGTKITTTPTNRGGLSTREVNDNILAPWTKRRPVTVTEDSSTGDVEYDANIRLVPDGEAITLTLGDATYDGCEVTVSNTGDTTCVIAGTFGVSGRTYSLSAGKQRVFVWLTDKWIEYSAVGDDSPTQFDDNVISFPVLTGDHTEATSYTYNVTRKGNVNVTTYLENLEYKYFYIALNLNGNTAIRDGGKSQNKTWSLNVPVKKGDVLTVRTRQDFSEDATGYLRFFY